MKLLSGMTKKKKVIDMSMLEEKIDEAIELVKNLQDVIDKIKNIGEKIDDDVIKKIFIQILIEEILSSLSFSPFDIFGILEGIKYDITCRRIIENVVRRCMNI